MALRILAFCGSLRAHSSNLAVIEAAQKIAKPLAEVRIYTGLAQLPYFNADLDGDAPPEPVRSLRREVGQADALLICSPEYARGVAGVMKNALDWLVGSLEFPGKPVAVINASQRSAHADAALRLTLSTMSARIIEESSVTLPLLGKGIDAEGLMADPRLAGLMSRAIEGLVLAAKTEPPGLSDC